MTGKRKRFGLTTLGLAVLLAAASSARAQSQYIGYVYPAGGERGATFPIRLGGQGLLYPSDVVVTGEGVSVRIVDYFRTPNNQEMAMLREQLNLLKKPETVVDDVMAAKMAWFEFPAPIGPETAPAASTDSGGKSEKEIAKANLIKRIESLFAEDERDPAVRSHTELVFAEVTVDPGAKPGRREIRVVTKRGISNPLPFMVGQVPEVARKPMKTAKKQVLGKEYLAKRNRPAEEEEMTVAVPCTMNGQTGAGELNRYRFEAKKGQRLLVCAKARGLIPYVADGVPGWYQAVVRIHDAQGKEVAYSDDFRSDPDPVIYFEVPADGEYVLTMSEALYRGRESFTYRITIGELPFVSSIFPLGGQAGQPVKIEMEGWNLEKATLAPPPADAKPGTHLLTASSGAFVSNAVPFVLGTLPEVLDEPANSEPAKAQKVALPVVVNGRADRPGEWDVFEVEGKAGQTIVAEVHARRLGSPFDSFVKITGVDGKVIALNDDHYDAGSGMNTDHADSYLMAKLPADGKYHVHIGDTRRQAGKAYSYRLRISHPIPDFELRVVPSQIVLRSKSSAAVKIFAIRKDGFDGPIQMAFKNLPEGIEAPAVTLPAGKEEVAMGVKTTLDEMEKPVNLTLVGTAKAGDKEIVREAVPSEDKMQAFLWRHLLPSETLPVLVCNPSYKPSADRIRPPIRDQDRPKDVKRDLTSSSVTTILNEIETMYQEWFFTDEFTNNRVAGIEARLIK